MDRLFRKNPANDEEAEDATELLASDPEDPSQSFREQSLRLPPKSSTPAEVREWLYKLLLHKGIDASRAKDISARWTVGGGLALQTYSLDMYRNVFNRELDRRSSEEVWIVYAAVKGQQYREEDAKRTPLKVKGMHHLSNVRHEAHRD